MCVKVVYVCLWFVCTCMCIHVSLIMFPFLYAAFPHVCALQAVCARTHAHTFTLGRTRKQNQLVCATQTLQWSSRGSLGQSKTTILRCRRDPVESCNLSRRSLTWRHETAGFAWICISDLIRGVRAGLNVTLYRVTTFLISFMHLTFPLFLFLIFLWLALSH